MTNKLPTRTDTLNARNYATQYRIAENALKTLAKIKEVTEKSMQKHGDIFTERPDLEYIYFQPSDLMRIAYDYTFAALENFLEHVGFILFDDWESDKAQRHYSKKQMRLLDLSDVTVTTHLPNWNYGALEAEWQDLINTIDFDLFAKKRNPIKHIHSGRHDGIKKSVVSNSPHMNANEFASLVEGTSLELTEIDCSNFLSDVNNFIKTIHNFLNDNKLMFRIYCHNTREDKIEIRRSLHSIFLTNPLASDLYSSQFTAPAS